MIKILANDGIHDKGRKILQDAGFEVDTNHISQDDLSKSLNNYDVLLVRSATKVRESLIDQCPNLKMIIRGGVGLDNIDVEYAKKKGVLVFNTPSASTQSVAEMVFAHLFSLARSLYESNAIMPEQGDSQFKALKKSSGSKGFELQGKTMGIYGAGRIGRATAKKAIALGMNVVFYNINPIEGTIEMNFDKRLKMNSLNFSFSTVTLNEFFQQADIISLHIPAADQPVIGAKEISKMKDGVILINCARGGIVNEKDLCNALKSGKVAYAGIDVFDKEPPEDMSILQRKNVSLSPHIGGSTKEAQARIGLEIAERIISHFS